MQKMLEAQRPARNAEFDKLAAYVLEKNAPLMKALARSEREDAAMSPEEMALSRRGFNSAQPRTTRF